MARLPARLMAWSLIWWLAAACSGAAAQSVTMSGSLGNKAVLVIDGVPRTMAVGSRVHGVRLVSVNGDEAVVDVRGRRATLRMGAAQVNLGGQDGVGTGTQIVLTAGSGGHFTTLGSINGRAVRFVVDTGATHVSISQAEAERIGLRYRDGQRGLSQTANGVVPVHLVMLDVVRVGDVLVYGVEATVLPTRLDQVLLGNSFLTRFQMKRQNDTLTLDKKP